MVARKIGESARIDPHAVEPELIEPMRGSFESQMRDTIACDLVELAVQLTEQAQALREAPYSNRNAELPAYWTGP